MLMRHWPHRVQLALDRHLKQTPETIEHNMRTALVDKGGMIRRLETNNLWDVDDFVRVFKEASEVSD